MKEIFKAALSLLLVLSSLFATGQTSAVAPINLNVLYIGVDNPLAIAVSGYTNDELIVAMWGGTIKKEGGIYIARVSGGTEATIKLYVNEEGTRKEVGSWGFRVKSIPPPVVYVAGRTGNDSIMIAELLNANGMTSKIPSFDWDVKFSIEEYNVSLLRDGEVKWTLSNSGQKFSDEVKSGIAKIEAGDKLRFDGIKAADPGGTVRTLSPIELTVKR